MKSRFLEYHIGDHLDKVYNDAIIVLDTNSLLNLYRYSEATREKYLEILSKVSERLYLTDHVCAEFYKNRYTLIGNRTVFIAEIKELLDENHGKLLNIIKNSSGDNKYNAALSILKHEDELKNKIIEEIEKTSQNVTVYLDEFKQDINFNYIQGEDPILAEIVKIFEGKISPEIPEEEKEKIYAEGEKRFKNQIPPGYKDSTKSSPEKFGDLIIWKELEKLAKELDKDILFISDDRKEDWVIKFKGMNLGPRKELIKEFYKTTNKLFYSITTTEFIKLISKSHNVENTESLEKETEIIQEGNKFTLENLRESVRIMRAPFEDWEKQQEAIRRIINPIEDWGKHHQEAIRRIVNPIEDLEKQQEAIRRIVNPIEDWGKHQEAIRRIVNPIEDWGTHQEAIRRIVNPIEDWEKQQEAIRRIVNPIEDLEKQQEAIRRIVNPIEDWEKQQKVVNRVVTPLKSSENQPEKRDDNAIT